MNGEHETRNSKNICNLNEEKFELRKGPWTLEEDNLLIQYIDACGEGGWNSLAKCAGLKRTGKSCRLRWLNYLKPDIKRGNLTPQEQLLILELHSRLGNRWSKIAQNLPGRTDNEIKNYWRTRVKKQARQLDLDANSTAFLEIIKCQWMPRLLEKVEQSNASFSTSPSSSPISTIANQDSTFSHFSKPHEIMTSVSPNSTFDQNNVHQQKSNLSNYSNSYASEYQNALNLPEIQDNMMELSPSWESINVMNSPQNDCYSIPNVSRYSEDCSNMQAMTSLAMGCQEMCFSWESINVMNSTQNDCYSIPNVSRYSEDCSNMQAMTSLAMGCQEMCFSEYETTHNDCFNHEEEDTFWNTDELWQFVKTEDSSPDLPLKDRSTVLY